MLTAGRSCVRSEEKSGHTTRNTSSVLPTARKGMCSSYQIRNVVVEQLLLEDLRRVMSFAKDHEQGFIRVVMNNLEKELAKELSLNQKGYEQAQGRIITLDKIIQKLYEDMCWVKSRRNVFTRWRLNMKPNRKLLRQRWLC